MDAQSWLLIAAGVGAGSYVFRFVPLVIGRRVKFPPLFLDWLIYVSIGITAGLISKTLFIRNSVLSTEDFPIKMAAITVAVILQKRFGNTLLSLLGGVLLAVLLKVFFGPGS